MTKGDGRVLRRADSNSYKRLKRDTARDRDMSGANR